MKSSIFDYPTKGLLDFNLDKADNILRLLSLNSPLVKMGLLGTGAYFGAKALTPFATRLLSPKLLGGRGYDDLSLQEQEELKKTYGLIAASSAVLPTLLNNLNLDKPGGGLTQFPEKESFNKFKQNLFGTKTIHKESSFDMSDPMQAIPLSTAKETILSHPTLTPMTKATSMEILNTFPTQSEVTSKNIIDRAVASGIDFLKGGAFGAITAHALGLPNPYSTALITGILNTIL